MFLPKGRCEIEVQYPIDGDFISPHIETNAGDLRDLFESDDEEHQRMLRRSEVVGIKIERMCNLDFGE